MSPEGGSPGGRAEGSAEESPDERPVANENDDDANPFDKDEGTVPLDDDD